VRALVPRTGEDELKSTTPKNAGTTEKRRLPPGKGTELLGILAILAATLLGASFLSYHADDSSVLHQSSESSAIRNWIGPVGAELSALGFGLLGLAALLLPFLLIVFGWRRLRIQTETSPFGRGLGGVLLLVTFPGLLQLTLENTLWRGISIASGGGLGILIADNLQKAVGFAGTLFVLIGVVMAGSALLVQSTLGELLGGWVSKLKGSFEWLAYASSRRRQRREKEKSKRRVVDKHLRRADERRRRAAVDAGASVPADLPLRVTEKAGEGSFRVRKVKSAPVVAAAAPVATKAAQPQKKIPFPKGTKGDDSGLPPVNLLRVERIESAIEEDELVELGDLICSRCAEFGVEGTIAAITPGPVITVYEFQPAPGVKVSQIVNLQDDLALALKAESVRIERLPGRSTLGIEVPNKERGVIRLGYLLDQEAFKRSPSVLTMALGTTIHGEPFYADLATMPHLLVAGATGAGKSIGLQSMITSMVYKARREQVQFIFIDPKRIELGVYKDIPHLKTEVVVEPKKAANALRWAVAEMERRYRLLAEVHVRSLDFYNQAISDPKVRERLAVSEGSEIDTADLAPLPYYVVVIDELADLMMVSAAEVETSIARLAQMARAVGIHLIVSTQRPSVDVLTGTIKANFPCRISYATATRHDSRTILDQVGAEKLLGKGDMLFMPPGTSRVMRLHGAYITEQETAGLIRWLKKQGRPDFDPAVLADPVEERGGGGASGGDGDELFDEAARLVVAERKASASYLQRRMRIGFSRAARLIDLMENEGLLGPPQGSKPRDVLVPPDYFEEMDRYQADS
jgi:S-DNA-T family DNA segregation ATPase FtsK/SpoIIIE